MMPTGPMLKPAVTLTDIRDASARIRPLAAVTPLVDVADAAVRPPRSRPLFLKCENLQRSGAFKIRGAANTLLQLPPEDRARGVITYSSGNHGIAMSLTARLLGVPAVVVMPTTAPAAKAERVRRLGAEVIHEGTTTVQRQARAEDEADRRGLTIVPPFDHPWVIAGQGTIGLEILEQCPGVAAVFVPCSGGGLIAGIATAIRDLAPSVRIVGVEPSGAPKMTRSLQAGAPVTLDRAASIADGLMAVRPGTLTFPIIQALVDEVVTVGDEAIATAVRWVFEHGKMVTEPSGAAAIAAVLSSAPASWSRDNRSAGREDGGPIVAVVSGGNVDAEAFAGYVTGRGRAPARTLGRETGVASTSSGSARGG
ncbi:MAG: threonine/serine dehydratase [Acidobacteriota bacterium]